MREHLNFIVQVFYFGDVSGVNECGITRLIAEVCGVVCVCCFSGSGVPAVFGVLFMMVLVLLLEWVCHFFTY